MHGGGDMSSERVLEMDLSRKVFTLIELLVVIAVIAVLTGIPPPSLNREREIVRRIACLNNDKSLGVPNNGDFSTGESGCKQWLV